MKLGLGRERDLEPKEARGASAGRGDERSQLLLLLLHRLALFLQLQRPLARLVLKPNFLLLSLDLLLDGVDVHLLCLLGRRGVALQQNLLSPKRIQFSHGLLEAVLASPPLKVHLQSALHIREGMRLRFARHDAVVHVSANLRCEASHELLRFPRCPPDVNLRSPPGDAAPLGLNPVITQQHLRPWSRVPWQSLLRRSHILVVDTCGFRTGDAGRLGFAFRRRPGSWEVSEPEDLLVNEGEALLYFRPDDDVTDADPVLEELAVPIDLRRRPLPEHAAPETRPVCVNVLRARHFEGESVELLQIAPIPLEAHRDAYLLMEYYLDLETSRIAGANGFARGEHSQRFQVHRHLADPLRDRVKICNHRCEVGQLFIQGLQGPGFARGFLHSLLELHLRSTLRAESTKLLKALAVSKDTYDTEDRGDGHLHDAVLKIRNDALSSEARAGLIRSRALKAWKSCPAVRAGAHSSRDDTSFVAETAGAVHHFVLSLDGVGARPRPPIGLSEQVDVQIPQSPRRHVVIAQSP
mmetsp:Transcript_8556/g.32202  ORF Transcript_8556/g.32202 Transcript_8556/m.32202 type:complete len:524 (-) Transcript_8556:341-1912(-)